MKFLVQLLLVFLMLELIILCLFVSFRLINFESTVTLVFFNFLFASLTFQLNGAIHRKLFILTLGNLVGLFWNIIFSYFAHAGEFCFGEPFNLFYMILYPFLNLMWIIPFWSFSLGFLPKLQNIPVEVRS